MASGSTTLKKITARAKHIRHTHGGTWKAAVKKAGAEYRAGKIHGVKKRKVGTTKAQKAHARKFAIKAVKLMHKSEGQAIQRLRGVRSTFQAAAIGRLTTAQHISHAKEKIAQEIGRAEMAKFRAKTKTAKRKISKRISELKTRFRKLC